MGGASKDVGETNVRRRPVAPLPRGVSTRRAELLSHLCDQGEFNSAVSALKEAISISRQDHLAALSQTFNRNLVGPLTAFIETLFEDGRGVSAAEYADAKALLDRCDILVRLLRLGSSCELESVENLEHAWLKFAVTVSVSRVDMWCVESQQLKAIRTEWNASQKKNADYVVISYFNRWQKLNRQRLTLNGKLLSAADRVRLFKKANKSLTDRQSRRLTSLLKQKKIPAV